MCLPLRTGRAVHLSGAVSKVSSVPSADAAYVHQVLTNLTGLQRQALRLTYVEDHSAEQDSDLLGVPVSTPQEPGSERPGMAWFRSPQRCT